MSLLLTMGIWAHRKHKQRADFRKGIIKAHGYEYYLRYRTWNRIKDRRKYETVEAWHRRLALYGFDENGNELNKDVRKTPTKERISMTKDNSVFNTLYEYLSEQPRDVQTIRQHKWFRAYANEGNVYICNSTKSPACKISKTRVLSKAETDDIYALYKQGKSISDGQRLTFNASYWFALFSAFHM